jgi:hypothetical protein
LKVCAIKPFEADVYAVEPGGASDTWLLLNKC